MKKITKLTAHPSLKWLTFTQYLHDPKVKAVRVNGQIAKVNQLEAWTILGWVTIWRFIFFTMFTAHLSLKLFKLAQHKHEPKVKVVRVNGQITEVKQL